MSLGNGLHVTLSREEYDRSPRANYSKLKHLGKSPAHFRHEQMTKGVDTDAKKLGRCHHLSTLEPERFLREVAVWDGGTRRGKDWEAFKAQNPGRELIKQEEYEECMALQAAVRSHPVAGPYLRNGKHEVSAFWTYVSRAIGGLDEWSIDCKSRLDFVTDGALVDLKTTRDASPEGFKRQVWSYRYHTQAAFYSDAYFAATGRRLPYKIIAVENFEPYVVQVYTVPEHLIEMGREEYRAWLGLLHHCRSTSSWSGYSDGELELEVPRWAAPPEDEDLSGLGIDFPAAEQGA